MQIHKLKCAVCVVLIALLCVFLVSIFHQERDKIILDQRMADVRSLTQAYFKLRSDASTNIITMEDLVKELMRDGIRLHNPIPKDPTKPCYRLAYDERDTYSLILIEETNITDTQSVVVSGMDGSVWLQGRQKPKM